MGKFEKQLKYSIRKVSIGAASVVIGAFYLAMGAGVVHAETNTPTDGGASHSRPSPESETSQPNGLTSSSYGAEPAQNPGGLQAGAVHSVKEEMKTITRTIKYVNASDESKEVSATVTQTVTLTRKQGTEEWTTGKWEAQTSPTVNGFGAPDKSTIESKEVTSTTENEDVIVYYTKLDASSTLSTRGRRSKRDVENPPAGGTSNTSTGTETAAGASTENNETLNSALTERKGATVKPDQPGVNVPKGNEHGAHDPSAHLSFNDPDHTATVEEMWKIIQHMPDDFQNNERSYLRNMDTLGRELRFDKTAENPEGVPLQPGEIRELHDFGGWHAIDENGNKGKFVIGRKNAQGYFTGWHKVGQTENGIPIIEQGGMLGADALDNIYVHEQALDRRFDYMLMLVKGRTRANRNETVADNSTYDPRAQNERAEAAGANYNKLPFLEKDKFNKYSPGVVGYNGIEKKFTAFSTKYGSRVRVDFVTGYITDINGSKGSYRVVIKAQNSKGEETKVYDETISRVAEIVQNEELYKKGLNVEAAHENILKFLKDEFNYRFNKIKNEKVKATPLLGRTREKDYTPEQQKVYDQIVEEATEEAKKQGDIVMNVTEDFLSIRKSKERDSEWKKTFTSTSQSPIKLSNDLNNLLKNADKDTPNTPTWLSSGSSQAKADDRAYRLLTTLIPGAKKITYHVNDDQLEVETDKYTYTAARNGSKEVGIQGSDIAATLSADAYGANPQTFDRENTNTKANALNHGWATSSSEEFKHFSKFLGVDKGIERTNVISDEELSAKIKEAVGPGYSKLGKAGYFSTADIPLGTDIVSYTVQVIPSDNERVGVNPQSSRIQYNMPILADFSVIQDTVEPSKEVARRIITKLKEKGKITEDQEKKIKEEIDKSKKTSELRSAMSGDVKVKYQTVDGTLLTLKNTVTGQKETDLGKKDTDGTYIAQKDQLLGTDYDVTGKKLATLTTADGKRYRLKRSLDDNSVEDGRLRSSARDTGTITSTEARTVTYVYEEYTAPPTGKGLVHFKKQVSETTTEALNGYPDISLEGDVGTDFSADSVNDKITELKKAGYEIVSDTFTNGDKTIDSVTDTDGQDPSQVYNVTVREKVVTVTTPPTPNTPVDPTVPDGPKWPETGLAKSDLEKEVTRTITYVKKDTADGPEIADAKPTKKQTAHFKRSATYNLVTKVVTPGDWGSTDNTLTAVPTEKLEGYIADRASVEAVTVPDTSGNITEKVVYTKLGSWVPNLPKGVTPPEGTDMTPKPYPNHPTDPTKPGDPTPGLIPYVPGYTPNVGGTPLVPKNPTDLTEGYTPPTPTDPKTNIEINYTPDPQKAVVKVYTIRDGVKIELPNEKVSIDSGIPDAAIPSTKLDEKIKDLEKRGYIVDNKTPLKGETFDKVKDSETGDPSQVYELILRERTSVETETKSVTRTIKYYKIDETNGSKVEVDNGKLTNTKTAEFTREVTTNLATGLTTIGAWSDKQTLDEVKTPVLTGYIADKVKVPSSEVTADTESFEEEVVYKKIGNWVPKVPGVENPTPIPYPNDPNDPTKPKYPDYPTKPGNPGETPNPQPGTPDGETPGTPEKPKTPPVIPYVPGYTPKIGDKPLEPVDPNNPETGYRVPPIPETPENDTPIEYEKDPQKAVVKVFNTTTGTEVELPKDKVELSGKTGEPIPANSVTDKIAELEKRGYTVENKELLKGATFDKNKDPENGDPTQVFKLLVKERTVEVTTPPTPNTPVDPNIPDGPKWPETGLAKSDLEKEVTRTITYVKKETADGPEIADAKPTKKQTAHFKRSAIYNLVTKVVTPGDWGSTDNTLTAVPTEKLDGYVANVPSVEEVETNANSTNLDRKVVYTKLGSWIPKVPGVETPTPLPYPNHPTDPTKPGDPTDPNTPNVPVIPYVPGYTPKIGETPLQPKVPNDPTQGYIPPAVPTEPGTNTDITYVADPQKAVVKVVKVEGEGEKQVKTPLENDTVFINNGSTNETIPTTDLNTKIADLEKRGYVVENKTLLENQKFDNKKDPETGDPTQVFELLVKERTVTVTEPKNPNDPVDPDKPEGPKWPETGLAKSDLEKEVTRTITYVKKETADGPEIENAKPTKKQTAHFKRSATYNLVTKVVTPGDWTSTDKTLEAVPTEKLDGYVANVPSVEEVETNVNSTNLDRKVVYTKLGSWIPKVPGVETPTPLPYPNHPTDPTKPGDPTDPNTPNVPVIPYVPGYTPKIGETPLQPKVPNDPTQGYIPPAVPTEPGTNTDITYAADPQKAIVKYVVEGTTKVLHKEELTGDSGTTINYTTANKLAELKVLGYELVTDGFTTATDKNFDKDKTVDQTFEVTVKPKVVDIPPFEPTNPKGDDNPKPEPGKPIDPKNPNGPKWTKALIDKLETTKHVTRTITYVEDGTDKEVANKATDKVTFTRSLKVNVVTGDVVDPNVAWTSNDTTFDEVTSPVVKGYVLKANQGSEDGLVSTDGSRVAASENLTATSENQNLKVVYTKLGSWVPKVPGVETPTPLPYPNHPTDPTKPGEPEYPQPGTPVEPNTPKPPVIPYVPGYTPKTPDGNPLVPVDPEHPENGYKVPPVPTEPGNDTPITYVADPQKAIVKYVVEGTTKVLHKEELTGDSGTTINYTTANKLAELKVLGYELVTDGFTTETGRNFDKDKTVDQTFEVTVKPKVVDVPPFEPTNPKGDDNPKPEPGKPIDPENPNGPKWTKELIDKLATTKHVTRTITYVEDGTDKEVANKATDKVTFTRSLKVNVVTGDVVDPNVAWTSNDTTFDEVASPVVKGYVLKANQGSEDGLVSTDGSRVVASTNLTEASENQNLKVVYTKLGSWVPKVPGVETPTPLPYPNHPTDPTKPGEPEYPQPGTPVEPNTPKPPVIPYVPGYTPKTPDGNPLVPVDPEHPENGYKVPPVPTEPGNDTPITYEKVPDKPKPEITGTKEVTRTIKYVDEKGNELAKPSTDKVTFTRNGSDWNAVDGDSTFDAVKSPVVKGYILKDSAQKVVEKETVKSDAKDETITVVYTKVGSYVPKVPEGVTPPSPTPYDNDPQDPSKVVTPNPEKPQDPNDPNSPKVPVIPYVPGHTPKTPDGNPLVPVDPEHPEKGYNVPPVPTIPDQDTPITYVKDGQQKAITSFVDPKGNVLETPITETGDSNTPLTKNGEVEATIAKLKLKGYDVETNTYPPTGTFDNDPKVDQYFKVTLVPHVEPVKPFDPTDPNDPNKPVPGQPIDPKNPEGPKWNEELIKQVTTKKEVTRTINYVDEAGNKVSEPSTDKVTFTREAKINVVTGEITYGDWKAVGGDSTFDRVTSPVVKGYILKDPAQKEVAERKGITPTVENQTIEVVYKKLGSWIPKVPGVETPTPLPYPNDPTDPTKPGDPTDPNTPNVPVIPYVPGYTPKIGETPLQPKVPNDPTQGYIPPVPTEPGNDTPIEYVKVPNTPSPEEPVKPTPESNHITIWVDENGKPLKPEKPGTHEPGNIPGYRFITTTTKDGVTIHKFEKITPVEPNNPVPQKPTTPIPTPQDPTIPTPESQIPTPNIPEANTPTSETNRREELPNTGTEANANLAALGLLGALSGFGLLARKKKED